MITLLHGDCRDVLPTLPEQSVQCVVTSPPYWGLRDYGVEGQIGLESTMADYVAGLVGVFDLVWRVLRDDGTLWLNLGDCYANDTKWGGQTSGKHAGQLHGDTGIGRRRHQTGLPSKSLMGMPWRVALALQDEGWIFRNDIIWSKPNPMPESVTDRCTRSHEYLFLFAKSESYYFDQAAIAEPSVSGDVRKPYAPGQVDKRGNGHDRNGGTPRSSSSAGITRNRRTVWTIAPQPYDGAHFAVFPEALVEPCILAGSRPGDTILDPFAGTFTVGRVALRYGRHAIGIELNPAYCELADERTDGVQTAMEAYL